MLVAVRDSGPGLDPGGLDRLFHAFYTTKPQGMGMGLAISRSIVEAHGGRLWATANVPRGAVFQFTLPIDADKVGRPKASTAATTEVTHHADGARLAAVRARRPPREPSKTRR